MGTLLRNKQGATGAGDSHSRLKPCVYPLLPESQTLLIPRQEKYWGRTGT